jgi:hypothetical protein
MRWSGEMEKFSGGREEWRGEGVVKRRDGEKELI